MSAEDESGLEAVIAATRDGAVLQKVEPGTTYHVIEPEGSNVTEVDTEHLLSGPRRKTGTVHVSTIEGLKEYVARNGELNPTVWVHPTEGQIIAVLNDHSASAPAGWGDHRARVDLVVPEEWLFWARSDGVMMDQRAFAEHIEEGSLDLVSPDSATMLEVAQSIEATNTATFKRAERLTDGQVAFRYEENISATAGPRGETTIPSEFTIGLSPFLGEAKFSVKARLRYRIREGNLSIGYKLDRPQVVVRDALDRIALDLKDGHTVFIGTPR